MLKRGYCVLDYETALFQRFPPEIRANETYSVCPTRTKLANLASLDKLLHHQFG